MTSNLSKFYKKTRAERLTQLHDEGFLSSDSLELIKANTILEETVANSLIENQIGQFPLPMGVALNFIVDGKDIVVPMVVEEPSVIAACSNGAKFMRPLGGFETTVKERGLIGQIIISDLEDFEQAKSTILSHEHDIFELAKEAHPSIVARGGGLLSIEPRLIKNESGDIEFLTIHLVVDVKDAMGANIVNTLLEGTKNQINEWLGGNCLMSILSNYNDHSLVTSECRVSFDDLATGDMDGKTIAQRIVAATRYAKLDPYRAATHNKGIMNGIDSVLIATGNDTRAVAAGAHAYAARTGSYQSMSNWTINDDNELVGELTLPMPVGSVGGAISVLPLAKINQELLQLNSAIDLAKAVVSVGLAQNFSALKALVSEGIQRGHMSLHAKSLAIHAGAIGDEIDDLANRLKNEKQMNSKLATELLLKIRS